MSACKSVNLSLCQLVCSKLSIIGIITGRWNLLHFNYVGCYSLWKNSVLLANLCEQPTDHTQAHVLLEPRPYAAQFGSPNGSCSLISSGYF